MPLKKAMRKNNTTAQSSFFHAKQFEKFAFFFCPTFILATQKEK